MKKFSRKSTKILSFSLIERVILSAGAMLIFSVSFQIDQMPVGKSHSSIINYKSLNLDSRAILTRLVKKHYLYLFKAQIST